MFHMLHVTLLWRVAHTTPSCLSLARCSRSLLETLTGLSLLQLTHFLQTGDECVLLDKSKKILIIPHHRKLKICIALKTSILQHSHNLLIVNSFLPSTSSKTPQASALPALDTSTSQRAAELTHSLDLNPN